MNDKQNAELNMFQSVRTVLTENESKYAAIPVFNARVNKFKENISAIQQTDKERSETKVPVATEKKNVAEEQMIKLTLRVARVLNVWAFNVKNIDVQARTNISKSTFFHLQDNKKLTLVKSILATAQEFAGELVDYGFGPTDLEEFAAGVALYDSLIVTPRDTINERKGKTQTLAHLFAETKSLLFDELDKLVGLFKESDPGFYSAYFSARNVINTSYRKQKQ